MIPALPSYARSKVYDAEKDILLKGASDSQKEEYEDLHNGYDWMLFYKELHPEMEIPYKRWDGEIIDIGPYRTDGGPGSGNFGHKGVPGQVGGSAPSDDESAGKSTQRAPEDFLPKESYQDTPEFKEKVQTVRDAHAKRDAIFDRLKDMEDELKRESSPKPKNEWTEEDEVDAMLGNPPAHYTERGAALKKEYDEVKPELYKAAREADAVIAEAGDWMEIERLKARSKQLAEWEQPELKKATKDQYEGFTLETTGTSFGDEQLGKRNTFIAEMSPKEYLERCAYEIFDRGTMESTVNGIIGKNAGKYAEEMKDGAKFHLPYLNYNDGGQEGRHRAAAAYELGIDKIPVLIIGKPPRKSDLDFKKQMLGYEIRRKEFEYEDNYRKKDPVNDFDLSLLDLDRKDAKKPDEWITINGAHIPLDESGNMTGKVAEKIMAESKSSGKATEKKPAPLTKKRLNSELDKINEENGSFEDKVGKVKEALSKLPKGSKVKFPDSWDNDDGSKTTAVWDGHSWAANGGWSKKNGWNCSMEEMASYFVNEDESERPRITSVAISEAEVNRRALERARKNDKFYQLSNGGQPKGYQKAFPSQDDYRKAYDKAADDYAVEAAKIEEEYKSKISALEEKYEPFMARRLEIKHDSSLTQEQKEEKLQKLESEKEKKDTEKAALDKEKWVAYNRARKKLKSNFDADYYLKAKDKEWTMREDAYAVNPNFTSFKEEYMNNCVHCGFAWELRCRGYDVEALPARGVGSASLRLRAIFSDFESTDVEGGHEGTLSIIRQMREWGDGSRAIINTTPYSGSGHCYNVMNKGGNIVFVDSQSGSLWDTDTHGDNLDGGNIERSRSADLIRVDRSRIYEIPEKWVKDR